MDFLQNFLQLLEKYLDDALQWRNCFTQYNLNI